MRLPRWIPYLAAAVAVYGGYALFIHGPAVRHEAESLPAMTCQQIVEAGPACPRYVLLTDAALVSTKSVSDRDGETGHLELYHPIHSASRPKESAAIELNLILGILDEHSRRRIRDDRNARAAGLSPLPVEVAQTADGLPRWAQDGLARNNFGIPIRQCRVVTVGGEEPSAHRAASIEQLGLGCLVAGSIVLIGWYAAVRRFGNSQVLEPPVLPGGIVEGGREDHASPVEDPTPEAEQERGRP